MSRYTSIKILTEAKGGSIVARRGKKAIVKRDSKTLPRRTKEIRNLVSELKYMVRANDDWYKIAHKFYGNQNLWYLLAWYNKKPTDTMLQTGDMLLIPSSAAVIENFLETEGIDYYG